MSQYTSSKVVSKQQCPECKDSGKDNLAVYDDGHGYCFACGYFENPKKKTSKKFRMPDSYPLENGLPFRGIKSETAKEFGVRVLPIYMKDEVLIEKGRPVLSNILVYPYYDVNGVLCGCKYRDFDREAKEGSKKNSIWWETGSQQTIFGLNVGGITSNDLVICEGESDAMNLRQLLKGKTVWGLSGASSCAKALRLVATMARQFRRILLCFDNDEDGDKATAVALDLLPVWTTFVVNLPEAYKDISEMVLSGESQTVYSCFENAQSFAASDLITGDELVESFSKYVKNTAQFKGMDTGFPSLNSMLGGGLTRGDVMTLVAHTGRGKSTFCCDIAYNIMCAGHKVMWVGTEMLPNQMMRKFIERHTNRKLKWDADTGECSISTQQILDAAEYIAENIVFFDNMGGDFNRVFDACCAAVLQNEVDVVFVDVLGDVDSNFTKWEVAVNIMQQFGLLAQGNPDDRRQSVCVVLVQHTNSGQGGKESHKVNLAEIRGGAAIRHQATVIIALNGEVGEPERQLKVLKMSRMADSSLLEAHVYFDRDQRRYFEYTPEEEDDQKQTRRDGSIDVPSSEVRDTGDTPHSEVHSRLLGHRKKDTSRNKRQAGG